MTNTEQRLTEALTKLGRSVREDRLRPPGAAQARRRPVRTANLKHLLGGPPTSAWSRRRPERLLAPVAAAAALVLLIAGAATLPRLLHGRAVSSSSGGAAPTVKVGGFPTGVAFDAGSSTVYVSAGDANELTMIDAKTCNAGQRSGCAAAKRVRTHGGDPIGVAVNELTHTVYAANGGSDTVAVINAATCNAVDQSGCASKPQLIKVGGEPEFLALDQVTDTIYVANTSSGTVSVIDGATCNASVTSGCGKVAATARVGAGAFPIAVDAATNTIYVGVNNAVAVIDGATCDAASVTGCSRKPALISAAAPAGIAVDGANHTVYISGENGTVTVVDRNSCDATDTSGCRGRHPRVRIGADPRGNFLVAAASTLYATNAGSDTVSVINAATCDAAQTAGCAKVPPAFPAGLSPRRITFDPAAGTLYVVNTGASTLSMIAARTCKASNTTGCPTAPAPGTRVTEAVGGAGGGGVMESDCGPMVTAASSGQPAGRFTGSATELASGSVAGQAWSVWAKKGVSEPRALEDGGVVMNGRWYGLCAGPPNLFETELADVGPTGIDYGYVAFGGKAQVELAAGSHLLPAPQVVPLKDASFFIGALPKSACEYRVLLTHARSKDGSSMHQLGFGKCEPGQVAQITGSDGEWSSGQGAWAIGGFGLAPLASVLRPASGDGSASLPNIEDDCSPGPTNTESGKPGSAMTDSSVQVATGTTAGFSWSLRASKTSAGVTSVERGGLVVDGRWYGLCPGAPNPAEFELIDAGSTGLVYGYVANPGAYAIHLSGGIPAPRALLVRGGTFFIGQLPRSACSYHTVTLNAVHGDVSDMHQFDFGQPCRADQLVTITGGEGAW
jgi:YVTN family beta-propeller protein